MPVDGERVALHHARTASREHLVEHGNEMAVELERDDLGRARIRERKGQ